MGKLSTFKHVVRAFELIDRDNLGTMSPGLKLTADVPRELEESFKILDTELAKLEGKKLRDVVSPEDMEANPGSYELVDDDHFNDALENLANPIDEIGEHVLKGMGTEPMNAIVVRNLLNEYFDGALGDMFRKPIQRR